MCPQITADGGISSQHAQRQCCCSEGPRLEEWLQDKNFIKFDQDKHNILHMRCTAPLHQDRLRCDWLGSSPTKKT